MSLSFLVKIFELHIEAFQDHTRPAWIYTEDTLLEGKNFPILYIADTNLPVSRTYSEFKP